MNDRFNRRIYSLKQLFQFLEDNFRVLLIKGKVIIEKSFVERIVLVVTEVNGCELCVYAHTGSALKSGLSQEDIHYMLSGALDNVPKEESVALFFAQHYADKSGLPSELSWNRVVDQYGEGKALSILASIRNIMIGNTLGIAIGAFKDRLKGKPTGKTSLGYELGILFLATPFIIISLITATFKTLVNRPLINFSK